MLKGIWWQMKLSEIFLGEVKIDALRGGGSNTSKRDINILFSRRPIVKASIGYHKCKIISQC